MMEYPNEFNKILINWLSKKTINFKWMFLSLNSFQVAQM